MDLPDSIVRFLGILLLSVPGAPALRPVPQAYREGFASISERDLRAWVQFLASRELEGRESGTRGYDVAAAFVASVLEASGVTALGENGSYFQTFDLVQRSWDLEGASLTCRSASGETSSIPLGGQVAASATGDIDWSAPWVFAGRGEGAEADAQDDFQGLPLAERVVLLLPRPGNNHELLGARLRGAKRVVVISDERVKARTGLSFPEVSPRMLEELLEKSGKLEVLYITREVADRIFKLKGTSLEQLSAGGRPARFPLDGLEIRVTLRAREAHRSTRNVVGYLEGSDPVLRREVVAIGAHLDHVGTRDGRVFFGADDDASGASAVLGTAKAFAANGSRPRRSLLFLFFAAEEKGLLGSRYFVENPPVRLEQMVLELQLDMVGRNEELSSPDPLKAERAQDNVNSLHVVGSKVHSLELDPWVNVVNEMVGLAFEYDEERVYARSDQYNFGVRGVPVVFFFAGFHPDYHQPTDTADKINYAKLFKVTRLVFSLAFEVADRERRLARNRM